MTTVQQSSEFVIFVTHVEAENLYLKIWGQIDKNSATCVERMILPFFEQFARGHGCPEPQTKNLTINALCCAKFQNEGYYRAKICSIHSDGMVVVQFIDYGNIEILPQNEIHLLENIPGSETLRSLPPVAYEFTLANVLPNGNTWDDITVKTIKKTLWYNEYKATLYPSVVSNHRLIKLWYNNEDFGELLVKRQMAISATLQEMFRSLYKQPPRSSGYYLQNRKVMNENYTDTQSMQSTVYGPLQNQGIIQQGTWQNIPPSYMPIQPLVQEALVFKSRVLDVGSKHDVYVSFVEDGPQKFSVQVQSISDILSKLMRDINSHPTEPLQEPPLPGSVCLGRYTQDKVLCRAVVMAVMENKCKLYYVDFGHTEVLPYTDIFQLPPQHINPRVLSIRFTLSGVKDLNVTDSMKEYFKKIVSGKLLILHVRPPEGPPLIQYGDLFDNGNNIKDILKQAFSVPATISNTIAYIDPPYLLRRTKEMVLVTYVENYSKFFVQLESNTKSLESIRVFLMEYAERAPMLAPNQITIGLPCIALYEGQWYRAKVLNVINDKVRVLYVDYGNEEAVTQTSLRVIHNDLVNKVQIQAVRCILNDYEMLSTDRETFNQFETLVFEKPLFMNVIEPKVEPGLEPSFLVDLYDPEEMHNITHQLHHKTVTDKLTSDLLNLHNKENQKYPQPTLTTNIERFNFTTQLNLIRQQRNKLQNMNFMCHNTNKSNKKNQPDSCQKIQDNKQKVWKSKINDEKQHDNKQEKSSSQRSIPKFERFHKEGLKNNRGAKDEPYDKYSYNEGNSTSRTGKETRNRGKSFKNDCKLNTSLSDKSWSDKNSDTSSKGSNKHGKSGGINRNGKRIEGVSGRIQNSRWSDKENGKDAYKANGYQNPGIYKHKDKKNNIRSGSYKQQTTSKPWKLSPTNSSLNIMKDDDKYKIPEQNNLLGTVKKCFIAFINNPIDFYVHLNAGYLQLNNLMKQIASVYENGGDLLQNLKEQNDKYCIAQYSMDLKWYRGKIQSVEDNSAVVQFIDYGNTELVNLENIKVIEDKFCKLPIQAIHCTLLAITKDIWNTNEIETFMNKAEGKYLETEFMSENNGLYSVMLREIIDDVPQSIYINEEFCMEKNLILAKQTAESDLKDRNRKEEDYIDFDSSWPAQSLEFTKKNVIITWFINPNNFHCQTIEREAEFKVMMNEIQQIYRFRHHISYPLKAGCPVIALFPEDNALYRAEIIESNKVDEYVVQYIDFGNYAIVTQSNLYPVEKRLMHLPKQAIHCTLENISSPQGMKWSEVNAKEIDACFNADKYECSFYNIDDGKFLISLNKDNQDVADMLIKNNLAAYLITPSTAVNSNGSALEEVNDIERVDISLLNGQTLRVKVSSVVKLNTFYIQLPSASQTEDVINVYMTDKNPKVMPQLSFREAYLGAGCLVYINGMWRRAVVINSSKSADFGIKLIDTGAYNENQPDCMLALPSQLSVMQNQAIECCLSCDLSPFEIYEEMKESIENKEVIIYVTEVDNNRLIVKLYDLLGNRIQKVIDFVEKIFPICPMPIFSSTHKVKISNIEHSGSIWLQRNADYKKKEMLNTALMQYYSNCKKIIKPELEMLCATKTADGCWNRAKVTQITEKGAYVQLIDTGIIEEVHSDLLMELDPQFYLPHQLTINASLSVTLKGTPSEQINLLNNYLSNNEPTAILYNVNKKWTVELMVDEQRLSNKFMLLNLVRVPYINKSEDYQLVVGEKYGVYVSHVDSPSQFWIQLVDEYHILEQLQADLQIEAPTYPLMNSVPEIGTLCAAVYSIDNMWHRAEVLDADEDITTIRFIDYGNTDVIDNKSGNIRQIPDIWKSIKRYAFKCRLDLIPVNSEDWNETTFERFANLVVPVDLSQALIIADSIPKRIDLFINNKSVSEILVEEHHALKIHTEADLIDEIIELELDPHSAFVSHVSSPSEFWVQEEKSVTDLEIMSDRFIVADMFPKVEEITEGLLCVSKFPDDEQWYRARVVSHNDSHTEVIYIDYGNSAISTEIRAIPEDLATVPPLSRKCSLVLPKDVNTWSDKACQEFVKLAADGATIFLLDVLKEQETSLVKLTLNDKNVTDILAAFCHCDNNVGIEERLPPLGEENLPNVVISHVNNLSDFWIQKESNIIELEIMSDRLQAAGSFLLLNTFDSGTVCAAKYPEDEQWYRAKILSHDEHGTNVLYTDYGNSATTTELRILPDDIAKIPVLSKHCSLQMPSYITAWPEEINKKFKDLAADGATMFQFEILNNEEPMHVNLSINGKNVIRVLYENTCYADKLFVSEAEEDTIISEKTYNDNEIKDYKQVTQIKTKEFDTELKNVYRSDNSEEVTCIIQENKKTEDQENVLVYETDETIINLKKDNMKIDVSDMLENVETKEINQSNDYISTLHNTVELSVDDIVENMLKNALKETEILNDTVENEIITIVKETVLDTKQEEEKDILNNENKEIKQNSDDTSDNIEEADVTQILEQTNKLQNSETEYVSISNMTSEICTTGEDCTQTDTVTNREINIAETITTQEVSKTDNNSEILDDETTNEVKIDTEEHNTVMLNKSEIDNNFEILDNELTNKAKVDTERLKKCDIFDNQSNTMEHNINNTVDDDKPIQMIQLIKQSDDILHTQVENTIPAEDTQELCKAEHCIQTKQIIDKENNIESKDTGGNNNSDKQNKDLDNTITNIVNTSNNDKEDNKHAIGDFENITVD